MFENYNNLEEQEQKAYIMENFPNRDEIIEWWKNYHPRKELFNQEYTIYEVEIPKMFKAFVEYLLNKE